tara:strand:+ start:675 stop:812 length:138 start_codon:yes stop_codon:yes gene_type:complete
MDYAFRRIQGRLAPGVEQKMSELSDFRITKDKLFGHNQQFPLTPD